MEKAILISLCICFIWSTMNVDKMILTKFGDYLFDNLPTWLYKPISGCMTCMTPWYGSVIYIIGFGWSTDIFLIIPAASGLSFLFSSLILQIAPTINRE